MSLFGKEKEKLSDKELEKAKLNELADELKKLAIINFVSNYQSEMTLEEAIEHIEKVNNLSIEDRKDKTILLTSLSLRLGIVEYLIETKKFQDEDMSKADKVGDYIIKLGNELKEIKNEK